MVRRAIALLSLVVGFAALTRAGDTRTIVLQAATRDPKIVAEACRRYFAEEFDDEDRERRDRGYAPKTDALIRRDEEDAFVKMVIRFDPTDYVPRAVQITNEPVP